MAATAEAEEAQAAMKGKFKGTFQTDDGFDLWLILKLSAAGLAVFAVVEFVITFLWYIAVFFIGAVVGGTVVSLRARRAGMVQNNGSQTAISSYQAESSADYIRLSHVLAILHGPSDARPAIPERRDSIPGRNPGEPGPYDLVEKEEPF